MEVPCRATVISELLIGWRMQLDAGDPETRLFLVVIPLSVEVTECVHLRSVLFASLGAAGGARTNCTPKED